MTKKTNRLFVTLIAIVFLAFFTIGYDMPWTQNPEFKEPLMTPVVIWMMILMLVAATIVAIVSIISSLNHKRNVPIVNGIRVRRTAYIVIGLTILIILASLLLCDTDPILINGKICEDVFTLRIAGMFVWSMFAMATITVVLTIVCMLKKKQ